ncbi:hypothetical protein DEI81_00045 [Curtobacterium sp. MCBD17_013]|uniref:hypothetical protein n=1 Tax=unclassified Curtobacterium TaxID=257496 RepID=UPI000DAAA4B2|nr:MULTISPECIES: hypothetical protein [unclassified Curtobacterium]PZF66074.1 hypothetical protein DEI81_00045 [Curtobacterium sp. MCBD17_013]WIB64595.1 hypothetical protein DEI94_05250 [Curtobacterium sp. MCBD17_040]
MSQPGSGVPVGEHRATSASLAATARRHPSTIVFSVLAVVFAVLTVVLLVRIHGVHSDAFPLALRAGGLATIACAAGGPLRLVPLRRRDERGALTARHPGIAFVSALATPTTKDDLAAWDPGLSVTFPCQLAFSPQGIALWDTATDTEGRHIAERAEVLSIEPFHTPDHSWEQSEQGWGVVLHLAPRDGVSTGRYTGVVHLWIEDAQTERDEYATKQSIRAMERALGR